VELTWTCPLDKTDPDCVVELFDVAWETMGRDDEFGTVIKFVDSHKICGVNDAHQDR